jgi:amino acid transporter
MSVIAPRYFGFWSLSAIGLNGVIGAGFFVLPGVYYSHVGNWSPWLIALVGAGLLPIGFCLAEVSSRFSETGGPYVYVRAAFGPLAGFEVGWLMWITRICAHASVLAALVTIIGSALPRAQGHTLRYATIIAVTGLVTVFNTIGARPAAWFINTVSVVKFVPLFLLVIAGLFYVEWGRVYSPTPVTVHQIASAALLMAFALSGFESLTVPAGEAVSPQLNVPRSLLTAVLVAAGATVLANVVAIGMLGTPSSYSAPLGEAARRIAGPTGLAVITCTAAAAAIGHNMGSLLTASRLLYGMSVHADLPAFLSRLNPRFKTPTTALGVSAVAISVLATTNAYQTLATLSGLSRMLIYASVCAATLRLRTPEYRGIVLPPLYQTPWSTLMPLLGIAVSALIAAGSGPDVFAATVAALFFGAVYYFVRIRLRRGRRSPGYQPDKAAIAADAAHVISSTLDDTRQ